MGLFDSVPLKVKSWNILIRYKVTDAKLKVFIISKTPNFVITL